MLFRFLIVKELSIPRDPDLNYFKLPKFLSPEMKKITTAKKASGLRSLIADRKLFFWSSQITQVDTDKKKYGKS